MSNRQAQSGPNTPPGGVIRYRDRIFEDKRIDPYQARGKYKEPTRCGSCGAVFHRGRWQWGDAPEESASVSCPACQRIHDKLPAGTVTLEGPFVAAHRDELLHLIRNEAKREGAEHPVHRIMAIEEEAERIVVTTTDIHLPRRIGEALKSAWSGETQFQYGEDEYSARVHWKR